MFEVEIIQKIKHSILNYDRELAMKAAGEVIAARIDPIKAINAATEAIRAVGERFHKLEVFLPHVIMAADAMTDAVNILETALPEGKRAKKSKVVIGVVERDIHDIGKNIVSTMLKAAGFEVYDIGKDAPLEAFINKAKEVNADVIAVSTLMSITMPQAVELIEELERLGLREKYKVVVGGAPTTQEWAEEIGADGWGRDAQEAVAVIKRLTE